MPIQEAGEKVIANVERVIVGKHEEVRLALVALLCQGHLLIEDVPGTGKPCSPRPSPGAWAAPSDGSSSRRTCAPDVTGLSIFNRRRRSSVPAQADQPRSCSPTRSTGRPQDPVRPARVHGRQATIDGTTYPMPSPFLVIATRTPSNTGHLRVARAQLDRFILRLHQATGAAREIVILDEQKRAHPSEARRGGLARAQSAQAPFGRSMSTRPSATTSCAW